MKNSLLALVFLFSLLQVNAQNVGIGTISPSNKLEVSGNLLVMQPLSKTSSEPTAAQTLTMVNSVTQNINNSDSTGRIYDPGGATGNYIANLNSSTFINLPGALGLEITIESIDLGILDSLFIVAGTNGNTLLAVGNNYNIPGTYVYNTTVTIIFKSNGDNSVGQGFSILFKKIYPDANTMAPVKNYAGNALFFDSKNASFRAGLISSGTIGNYSVAMGKNSSANGVASTAIGNYANAVGDDSTAMGYANTASGLGSTAMGVGTRASDEASVSMGENTIASDFAATAFGNTTTASGPSSTALGFYTTASGGGATALGGNSTASGYASVAIGYYPTASGYASVAIGSSTTASNEYAIAMGNYASASGLSSIALGSSTKASGSYSTTMGRLTKATSYASTSLGDSTTASGIFSTATGYNTLASGLQSTAMGNGTKATYISSTALGDSTTASGAYSTAMGNSTFASGSSSTAMGNSTIASGSSSTAMGDNTIASGYASTAMGTKVNTNYYSGAFMVGDADPLNAGSTLGGLPNQMVARFYNGYYFMTSGNSARTGALMNRGDNAWSAISDSTRKENQLPVDGEAFLKKISRFRPTTWNYKGQDPKTYRHYGPMAQDFYNAFGKDALGKIGNDTLINSADFLGVNFTAIHALEKRTEKLMQQNEKLVNENAVLRKQLDELGAAVQRILQQMPSSRSVNQ